MITDIITADVTDPRANPGDLIIGMNTKLAQASAIGRPFVSPLQKGRELPLGSVLSFDFDDERRLHMLICHHIGKGGWARSDQHIRFCLDYLWQQHGERTYSIVKIGTGPVGMRDGANSSAILSAIADSFLPTKLFLLPPERFAQLAVATVPMKPFRLWDMVGGERPILVGQSIAAE